MAQEECSRNGVMSRRTLIKAVGAVAGAAVVAPRAAIAQAQPAGPGAPSPEHAPSMGARRAF